jgi:hypothetical protein
MEIRQAEQRCNGGVNILNFDSRHADRRRRVTIRMMVSRSPALEHAMAVTPGPGALGPSWPKQGRFFANPVCDAIRAPLRYLGESYD